MGACVLRSRMLVSDALLPGHLTKVNVQSGLLPMMSDQKIAKTIYTDKRILYCKVKYITLC